jgi:hypothetical protein
MLEVPCAFAPARSVVIHVVFDEMGAPLFLTQKQKQLEIQYGKWVYREDFDQCIELIVHGIVLLILVELHMLSSWLG